MQDKPQTRWGMLSIVGSIYDPLGLVSPFTLVAKLMIQNLCRLKSGWDDPIPKIFEHRWNNWLGDLKTTKGFIIKICFKPEDFGPVTSAQLHCFTDASEKAYGTVTYLWLKNYMNRIHIAFVLGKSRVSLLKPVTIPCLELTAAVLAVKVDKMLRSKLQLKLEESQYCTDSTSILKYWKN